MGQTCLSPNIRIVGKGAGGGASAVKSQLGPDRDALNTIEARRRAGSVDNHSDNHDRHDDNRSCHHDDRGRRRRYDSDDNRDRS
jgi:hypothetical protein